MRYKNVLITFVVMCCLLNCASAGNDSEAFTDITKGIFSDTEGFLFMVVLALVQLIALISVLSIIIGWFFHKEKLFMRGIMGCVIIIAAAIIYFISIEGFHYIQDKYWVTI